MSTVLHIDTTQSDKIRIALSHNGKEVERISQSRVMKAQMTLPLIEELVGELGIQLSDILEINVALGTASLTGVRVGAAIANMLGTLLNIPVNGKRTLAFPDYSP